MSKAAAFLSGMSHTCRTKTEGGKRFSGNRLFSAQGCTLKDD